MNQLKPSLIIFLVFIYKCASELRFCHQGPHKVKDAQCAGGILFNEKITPKCLFYAPDSGGVPLSPTYNFAVCPGTGPDGIITSIADRTATGLQRINLAPGTGAPAATTGEELSAVDCVQECLADVMSLPVEEHIDEGLPARNSTEEEQISERLFSYLMEGEDDDQRGTPGLNVVKIFREVQRVVQKFCGHPYVTERFQEQVEYALRWLLTRLSDGRPPDMGNNELNVMIHALENCIHNNDQTWVLQGTHCATKARIETITISNREGSEVKRRYRVQPKSYRWGKFDPFIEAAWASIDFVHNFCFAHFTPKLNHLHLFQKYMESLFTPVIQSRWANPPVFKRGDQFWNNLAQTKDVNWTMKNLDFCAQTAIYYSPFEQRLDRPFSTPLDLTGSTSSETSDDGTPAAPVGWADSVESYWEDYQARGGFESVVSNFGTCAKNEAEAERFQRSIGATC